MARKLTDDRSFGEHWQNADAAQTLLTEEEQSLWLKLGSQRDTILELTPELIQWFGNELPIRSRS